jgi:lysophospholipase L1-like esterase
MNAWTITEHCRRLILLAIVLAGCGAEQPSLPRLSGDAIILAFGDSLTYGTGAARGESYPAVLAELTGRRVVNAGKPGEVSADGLKRLPGILDQHRPALLILCHGGNDLLRRKSSAQTADNLRAMIDEAKTRGVAVLLLAVPEPGLLLSAADLYEKVAQATGVPLLEDLVPEILAEPQLKSDPIHPNARGYRKMAEGIVSTLREQGAL